jgi:hypothetical protein
MLVHNPYCGRYQLSMNTPSPSSGVSATTAGGDGNAAPPTYPQKSRSVRILFLTIRFLSSIHADALCRIERFRRLREAARGSAMA